MPNRRSRYLRNNGQRKKRSISESIPANISTDESTIRRKILLLVVTLTGDKTAS